MERATRISYVEQSATRVRTSNGTTKLILQNAAFRPGKLLRSPTSVSVALARATVNRFAAALRYNLGWSVTSTRRGFVKVSPLAPSRLSRVEGNTARYYTAACFLRVIREKPAIKWTDIIY